MTLAPAQYPWPASLVIGPTSRQAVGIRIRTLNMSPDFSSSLSWPAANRALFYPFWLPRPEAIYSLWFKNGGTVSGNVELGVYTRSGALVATTGSVARSGGANSIQQITTSGLVLPAGDFYMAMAASATTTTGGFTGTARLLNTAGFAEQSSAFNPLPSSFTLSAYTSNVIFAFGLSLHANGIL